MSYFGTAISGQGDQYDFKALYHMLLHQDLPTVILQEVPLVSVVCSILAFSRLFDF